MEMNANDVTFFHSYNDISVHTFMLSDAPRCAAYDSALSTIVPAHRAAKREAAAASAAAAGDAAAVAVAHGSGGDDDDDADECIVIDVGCGTGLLSMMASRAGTSPLIRVARCPINIFNSRSFFAPHGPFCIVQALAE